ncbi:MAG: hypothetical protein PHP65_06260, partial [Bacilli bacterium]|nr:hypothetical protein [Bacilli bacterium]
PMIEDEHFVGWDLAFTDVEADLIIKPIFDDAYQITFIIDEEVVLIVNDAKGSFGVPLIPAKIGYDQIPPTWSLSDFSNINEDVIVFAQYTINSYTVIFVGLDNKQLKTEIVEWQKPALAPTNTEEKNYTFKGWDREFTSITENMVVKAEYEQAKSSCSNLSLANLSFAFLALAWLIIKRKHN